MSCATASVTCYLANSLLPENEINVVADIAVHNETDESEYGAAISTYWASSTLPDSEAILVLSTSTYNALGLDASLDVGTPVAVISPYHALGLAPDLEPTVTWTIDIECGGISVEYIRISGIDERRITQTDVFRRTN